MERMNATNPFIYGNPLTDPQRFIGRRTEVEQIYSRLRNPEFESSSLVGERRMGKTSVLNFISHPDIVRRNGLDPAACHFVYVDLQMLGPDTTPTRLYQHLLRRIGTKIEDTELKEMLDGITQSETIDNYDLSDLFDIVDQKEQYIVLLLDEFENIGANANFGPEFYYGLRSLAIHHNLALVTSSQSDLVELSRSDAVRSSPFFNIFATIHLQPLSTKDVGEFLQTYLEGTGVPFTQTEVQYLWQIAGGFPFLLQMASAMLFRAHQAGHEEAQRIVVVHSEFPAQAQPHLRNYWEFTTAEERIILSVLALLHAQKTAQGQSWTAPQLEGWYRRTSNVVPGLARRGLLNRIHDQYLLFSTTFADSIIDELTADPSEPMNAEEWQQKVADGLAPLPEGAKYHAQQWLLNTRTAQGDLLIKWLADPQTVEAALELIGSSGAPFHAIGELPPSATAARAETSTVASLAGVELSKGPGPSTRGQTSLDEAEAAETAGADIELIFTPPPDPTRLLQLCQWLEQIAKAEIEEMAGSSEGGTSVRILLKRPIALAEMLLELPEVEEVTERPVQDEESKGPRFIKKRKDTRGRTPAALQRWRVVLRSPSPLETEEPAQETGQTASAKPDQPPTVNAEEDTAGDQ